MLVVLHQYILIDRICLYNCNSNHDYDYDYDYDHNHLHPHPHLHRLSPFIHDNRVVLKRVAIEIINGQKCY